MNKIKKTMGRSSHQGRKSLTTIENRIFSRFGCSRNVEFLDITVVKLVNILFIFTIILALAGFAFAQLNSNDEARYRWLNGHFINRLWRRT